MNYGLPYRGSKNKIAKDIIDRLPAEKCLLICSVAVVRLHMRRC